VNRSETKLEECTLGLDVGGTKMAGCVLTAAGEVVASRLSETLPARGGEVVVADALVLVESLLKESRELKLQPVALGISVCELVDRAGNIVSDFTLPWRDPSSLDSVRRLLPVTVEADSRAAALAEATYGAGQEFSSFLYVTIGTGISCSLVLDGVPYQGARGCTGTMATGALSTLCGECGTISLSCLEQIASGSGIEKRYSQQVESVRLTAKDVLQASARGDIVAQKVILEAGECIGSAISLLVNVLDPYAVVVGGGLGSSPGEYWETLVQTARKQIWSDIHRSLPLVQGSLGINAGAIGAALRARQSLAAG